MGARTTRGTVTWSSYISRNFEIPFTIWSSPSAMKSPNMISRIGRWPRSAMPAATPKSEASLIGVVRTRSGIGVAEPLRTLNAPPYGRARPRRGGRRRRARRRSRAVLRSGPEPLASTAPSGSRSDPRCRGGRRVRRVDGSASRSSQRARSPSARVASRAPTTSRDRACGAPRSRRGRAGRPT